MEAIQSKNEFCPVLPSFTWVKLGFTGFAQPGLNHGLNRLCLKRANPGRDLASLCRCFIVFDYVYLTVFYISVRCMCH